METPNYIDSKFRLAIIAAKRAKQLVNGAKKKMDFHAENPLTIALEEIDNGLINFRLFSDEDFALEEAEAAMQKLEAGEEISLEGEDEIVLDDESDLETFMEDSKDEPDLLEPKSE